LELPDDSLRHRQHDQVKKQVENAGRNVDSENVDAFSLFELIPNLGSRRAGEYHDENRNGVEDNVHDDIADACPIEAASDTLGSCKDVYPVKEDGDFQQQQSNAVENTGYVNVLGGVST